MTTQELVDFIEAETGHRPHRRTVQGWCKKLGFPLRGRDYQPTEEEAKVILDRIREKPGKPAKEETHGSR